MKRSCIILLLLLGIYGVGQNNQPIKDTRHLMQLVKEYKNEGKIDSSYYFLDIAKKRIFKNRNKDSILLYHTWKIELARFDHRRYLTDKTVEEAEDYYNANPRTDFNKDILAFYLNRRLAAFTQYHFANQDTIQLSLNTVDQILDLKDSITNKSIIAYTLNEKAQIFDFYLDENVGLELYLDALNYANENGLLEAAIDISINLARRYERNGSLSLAIKVLETAFERAQSNQLLWQSMVLSDLLHHAHKNNNDFEAALRYKEIHFTKFEEYQRQNNLKLLQDAQNGLRLDNQNIQLKTSRNMLILVSVFLIILTVLLFVVMFSRKKIQQNNLKLAALSQENLFLVSEANHRINNNLQLIIILITDQLKDQNPKEQEYLRSILSKIESISALHSHLYKKEDKSTINMEDYLNEVMDNFTNTFFEKDIQVSYKFDHVSLQTDFAMYLGLLVTELCLNTIKHAFDELQTKEIDIECKVVQNALYFNFTDNGVLCNEDSIQPKLVLKICKQLKVVPLISCRNGFHFNFQKQL